MGIAGSRVAFAIVDPKSGEGGDNLGKKYISIRKGVVMCCEYSESDDRSRKILFFIFGCQPAADACDRVTARNPKLATVATTDQREPNDWWMG